MRIIEWGISRRTVIEAYARYDCSKKGHQIPNFAAWDWFHADAIDREMKRERLKCAVLAGYRLWIEVEVTMSDLRECAVVVMDIFRRQSRKLGNIEAAGRLDVWEQKSKNSWYDDIRNGQTPQNAPLILRPAVSGEFPARWYIEDGSGRAIAFVKNQSRFNSSQTLAVGYLGCEPDHDSAFMRQNFAELLQRGR